MKISELPEIAAPDGSESALVLKNGVAKRALLSALVSGAVDAQVAFLKLMPGQNIVQDSLHEIISRNPYAAGFDHLANTNAPVRLDGGLSGSATPVIAQPAGTNIVRKIDGAVTPLIEGAALHHSLDIYTNGLACSVLIRWAGQSGQIGPTENYAVPTGDAGVRTVNFINTVPEGATFWQIEVSSAVTEKELVAVFAAYGGAPVRLRAPLQRGYLAAVSTGRNITPAPLLKVDPLANGYLTAYANWTASDVNHPRGGGSITGTPGGTDAVLDLSLESLGLIAGDVVSFKILAFWPAGSTGNTAGVSFRDASDALIPNSTTTGVPPGGPTTTGVFEIWRAVTIPATAKTIRFSVSGSGARKLLGNALAVGMSPPDWSGGSAAPSVSATVAQVSNYSPAFLSGDDRPVKADINALLHYGQSVSNGTDGGPLASALPALNNLTFLGGPRAGAADAAASVAAFAPLAEIINGSLSETPCSGSAWRASQELLHKGVDPLNYPIFSCAGGIGSKTIAQLSKGSSYYAHFLAQVQAAKNLADAAGKTFAVHAISWIQGENDGATSYADYYAALKQLRTDLDTDIRAIVNQNTPIPMLNYQTELGSSDMNGGRGCNLVQRDICLLEPHFYFVTPIYHLQNTTTGIQPHKSAVGYRRMSEYFGRAFADLVFDGIRPRALTPIAAWSSVAAGTTTVRIRFQVPVLPLVFDPSILFGALADNGVTVHDDTGKLTGSNYAIENGDTVRLDVNRALGDNPLVRLGKWSLPTGQTVTYGGATTIRDSTTTTTQIDGTDYNLWYVCPHAKLPIVRA